MIKNLILSAGGVNGLFFIGALKYLTENNLLNNLENIFGTSIGSIFSFLYLLGFSIDEIEELSIKVSPYSLLNIDGKSIITFLEDYGLDDGEKIIKILKIISKRKLNKPNITLKELYDITKITFTISAINVNLKKIVYFSHNNYPNLEIYKAIRMSSSIPILFKPYLFENNYFVDGGVIDTCSLNYYKNTKETLGLMLSTKKDYEIDNFKQFFTNLFCSPIQKVIENYYDKPNVIIFDTKDSEGLNFDIKKEKIKELIELGYKITQDEIKDILEYFKHT